MQENANQSKKAKAELKTQGWRTTDKEEIERRRLRGETEPIQVRVLEADHPMFGTFEVGSASGVLYHVEIRSVVAHENSCDCVDYEINGLGTCKHIEGVLHYLKQTHKDQFDSLAEEGIQRCEVYLQRHEAPVVRILFPEQWKEPTDVHRFLGPYFSADGSLLADPVAAIPSIQRTLGRLPNELLPQIRFSRHVEKWWDYQRKQIARSDAKAQFLEDLKQGKRSLSLLKRPLYSYQEQGVLHLAFNERAMLADEMGLGKTVQAIAACGLLKRLRDIKRVLVISPASLKAEWEEQIVRFTNAPSLIIQGQRAVRLKLYHQRSFFYLTNYEQIRSDLDDIQNILQPDVIILDEAQRIKNWQTKIARTVKQLKSPYMFVLTGTPLENRIDEIYSIMQVIDPHVFGPLFRFNRVFYRLNAQGNPEGYKNLGELHRRLSPFLLRRRKHDIEDQLPERMINNYFVRMTTTQNNRYEEYNALVARLMTIAQQRILHKDEMEKLQRYLACMRMLCDSPYILDEKTKDCPKVEELDTILEEVLEDPGHKVLIFSEWKRMLELVREFALQRQIGFAWHTGSISQQARRSEIHRFKEDPDCRLFLSTDTGSTGLNLQAANIVINLDLPWNPARLEQRIARAWRAQQTKVVQVINLICENSIEHRMLSTLAQKQALADGVLDGAGEIQEEMELPSGRAAMIERLEVLMGVRLAKPQAPPPPANPLERLKEDVVSHFHERIHSLEVYKGENEQETLFAVVDHSDEAIRTQLEQSLKQNFPNEPELPKIEVIDQAAYQTIQRLIEAGILKLSAANKQVLYHSSDQMQSNSIEHQRQLEEARRLFAEAERNMRMAAILSSGDFPLEAAPPAYQALELGAKCLAQLYGEEEMAKQKRVPLNVVERHLKHSERVDPNMFLTLAQLREYQGDFSKLSEAHAKTYIDSATLYVNQINETLGKVALGGVASA